jgi:hypothetical protein
MTESQTTAIRPSSSSASPVSQAIPCPALHHSHADLRDFPREHLTNAYRGGHDRACHVLVMPECPSAAASTSLVPNLSRLQAPPAGGGLSWMSHSAGMQCISYFHPAQRTASIHYRTVESILTAPIRDIRAVAWILNTPFGHCICPKALTKDYSRHQANLPAGSRGKPHRHRNNTSPLDQ